MNQKQQLGKTGESRVDEYLEANGWTLLERNYRWRGGEIDRIALEGQTLVFIEVKTRSAEASFLDFPPLRVEQARHLVRSAKRYIFTRGPDWEEALGIEEYRFDCLCLVGLEVWEHIRDLHLPHLMRGF